MGYTSGFGTRFAAPTLALAALTMIAPVVMASETPAATSAALFDVTVNVSGMRNAKGQIMICLTQSPAAFPDCRKDAKAHKKLVPVADAASIIFNDIAAGTYAVAIVHDENANNKMDLRIFIPREGFAFSRNPKIGVGLPKFASASFSVGDADVVQSVKMKYIF